MNSSHQNYSNIKDHLLEHKKTTNAILIIIYCLLIKRVVFIIRHIEGIMRIFINIKIKKSPIIGET